MAPLISALLFGPDARQASTSLARPPFYWGPGGEAAGSGGAACVPAACVLLVELMAVSRWFPGDRRAARR